MRIVPVLGFVGGLGGVVGVGGVVGFGAEPPIISMAANFALSELVRKSKFKLPSLTVISKDLFKARFLPPASAKISRSSITN